MPPPPPQRLPDELVEEVILRFPPEEPAGLVRARLVCRRWCRIVSDPSFRRRFREFHRRPPLLGMLCNVYDDYFDVARFVPTTAFPRTRFPGGRVLDARHGRVLCEKGSVLVVWDPITDEVRELPFPQKMMRPWTAAVLCSAVGSCSHLDCHHGPFLVVFVCSQQHLETSVYTYSSDAAAWSEAAVCQEPLLVNSGMGSALVGNALYFGNLLETTVFKYDLELRQVSLIRLPSSPHTRSPLLSLLTTEDGGLGLVKRYYSKLYIWARKDTQEVDAKWERRVIELRTVFPADVDVTKLSVCGSGVGIIFMTMGNEIYTIDLKTYKVMKKVYEARIHNILPYINFYTPVLRVANTDEGPSVGASTAEQT